MSLLGERLLAIHDALDAAGLAHAFGGAIALAYCTEEPRGTRDIDVNVFAPAERAYDVLAALPSEVAVGDEHLCAARRDGQVRVWWDETPVDLFLDTVDYHRETAAGVRAVPFEGATIPVIGCDALVVFKAMFDRTRDWGDIEAVVDARRADAAVALSALTRLIGAEDEKTRRLRSLLS